MMPRDSQICSPKIATCGVHTSTQRVPRHVAAKTAKQASSSQNRPTVDLMVKKPLDEGGSWYF
jgi:hypothetical protein